MFLENILMFIINQQDNLRPTYTPIPEVVLIEATSSQFEQNCR